MGYYGEQLKERMVQDRDFVKKNERILANTVSSRKISLGESFQYMEENLRQIERIADYYKIELPFYQPGNEDEDLPQLIDRVLEPVGIMKRPVLLNGPWWRDADAPMLVTFRESKGERILAIFPDTFSGYYYRDLGSDEKVRITPGTVTGLRRKPFAFIPHCLLDP